jgi:hypothetical protein
LVQKCYGLQLAKIVISVHCKENIEIPCVLYIFCRRICRVYNGQMFRCLKFQKQTDYLFNIANILTGMSMISF